MPAERRPLREEGEGCAMGEALMSVTVFMLKAMPPVRLPFRVGEVSAEEVGGVAPSAATDSAGGVAGVAIAESEREA